VSVSSFNSTIRRGQSSVFSYFGFRTVSEDVKLLWSLELLNSKYIPTVTYSQECFLLLKSDMKSLDFAVRKVIVK